VPAAKYTAAQRAEALALYETDGPSAVTARFGIPKTTVASWAKNAGVRTVRNETTRAAVEAKVVDGKLRRQNIVHRLYGQAEKILDDLEGEVFRTLIKAAGGADVEDTLTFVPPNDRKTLVQTAASAMNSAVNLEKVDADNGQSAAAVDQWLEMMTGGLRGSPPAGG
jgi:transposase-like protein